MMSEMIPLARTFEAEVKSKLTNAECAALIAALGKLRHNTARCTVSHFAPANNRRNVSA